MWEGWEPATCMPDRCFCEAVGDGLIRQPSNTWSNLGFCLAGVLMLVELKRDPRSRGLATVEAACFGIAVVLVGVTSGFYHASLTFLGQWLDVQSMYLLVLLALAVNLDALRPASPKRAMLVYLGANLALGVLLVLVPALRRFAFGGVLLAILFTEVWLRRRGLRAWPKGLLLASAAVQALAFGIWGLDLGKVVCAPGSLLQGHAAWHLLGAVASFLLWRYYRGPRIAA